MGHPGIVTTGGQLRFGPEDVCVAEWLIELRAVVSDSAGDRHASYTYNDPEQGQPGFRFERSGDDLLVSIVDSASLAVDAKPLEVPLPIGSDAHFAAHRQNILCRFGRCQGNRGCLAITTVAESGAATTTHRLGRPATITVVARFRSNRLPVSRLAERRNTRHSGGCCGNSIT
ncbi:MAG: hypothetical protein QOJ23_4179 [Actinomycetota bacterium]|nr:hypothetical protein [Actinomycetota bacterium]